MHTSKPTNHSASIIGCWKKKTLLHLNQALLYIYIYSTIAIKTLQQIEPNSWVLLSYNFLMNQTERITRSAKETANEAEKHKYGSVLCHKSRHLSHKKRAFYSFVFFKNKKIPKALLSFWETVECVLQVTIKISEITENTFCVAEITSTKLIHQWHDRDLCTMLML